MKIKNDKSLFYVINNYGWIVKSIVMKELSILPNYYEECINDIFLSIWNNIDRYDDTKSSFKNWIGAISKYKCIDYKRKYAKELKNVSVEDVQYELLYTPSNDNESTTLSTFDELIKNLSQQDKQIFTKLYIEDKNITEISEETGLNKTVIYNHISRGKKKLRRLWS